uniref:Ig-like domain-containing protein n=1 Tax=Callorhinchus milii TaxID=7868 RepID=A0A4W3HZT5_CALMI
MTYSYSYDIDLIDCVSCSPSVPYCLLADAVDDGWVMEAPEMVTGGDATLPCSFTMPGIHPSNIYVIWRRGSPQSRPFINDTLGLASHTNPGESETANEGNRYKVVGNVGDGDTSLRIRGLELNDTSRYFCHVHVTFTLSDGPRTPAVILSLSLVAGDGAGSGIVCTAEGEPPANITWIDPENNTLPINTSHTPVTHVPDKYQTVGEIRGPRLRGTYRCVAENTQGRDTRDILVAAPQRDGSFIIAILCLIPLVKFLTMLVTGIILVCKMGGLSLMLYKFHTFFCNMNTFTQCLSCRENVPRHWTVQGLHLS